MFLLNLPTGLLLVLLGIFIPESPKFLLSRGRREEAAAVMRKFGAVARIVAVAPARAGTSHNMLAGKHLVRKLAALSVAAVSWGLINFGLLLWLPGDLQEKGYSIASSSGLLAASALVAFPTVFLCALIYSRWSTKWTLFTMLAVTAAGLFLALRLDLGGHGSPILAVALLIIGSNGVLAVLLPYTAESFPMRIRGRATGLIAGFTKVGGVLAQGLSITALVPPLAIVAGISLAPVLLACALIALFGRETRGGDLRLLERKEVCVDE